MASQRVWAYMCLTPLVIGTMMNTLSGYGRLWCARDDFVRCTRFMYATVMGWTVASIWTLYPGELPIAGWGCVCNRNKTPGSFLRAISNYTHHF